MTTNTRLTLSLSAAVIAATSGFAMAESAEVIEAQRAALAESAAGKGYGPQSPRDIDVLTGANSRVFGEAPSSNRMNLCNIHFHAAAEHKGGEFTKHVGHGDGKGNKTGFAYAGTLTEAELAPFDMPVGDEGGHPLASGDTIEVHYVYTTADVDPGPTLGSCLSEAIANPQLRVETQVYVLVNDENALDFIELTKHEKVDGLHQAINIPTNTGIPVQYEGSTTGPNYNEKPSSLQVSWSVRPKVAKVNIATVAKWLENNEFKETHAHGVRNLVVNPELLSPIHW